MLLTLNYRRPICWGVAKRQREFTFGRSESHGERISIAKNH
jgi:hypothetical protein